MTIKPFDRIVRPAGVITWHSEADPRAVDDVFARIQWSGSRLSITGVEGPKKGGNAWGSCGQIVMHAEEWLPAGDFTEVQMRRFIELWNRWHLNDMQAGSPRQEQFLRDHPVNAVYPASHLTEVRKALANVGLEPDTEHIVGGKAYSYSTRWCTEEVPDEVLLELLAFPESSTVPAWV